jgi:hypothetical protein
MLGGGGGVVIGDTSEGEEGVAADEGYNIQVAVWPHLPEPGYSGRV